jgi:hypothetical protein
LQNKAVSAAMKDSRRHCNGKNYKPHHDSIGKALERQAHGIPAATGQDMSPSIPRVDIPHNTVCGKEIQLLVAHYFVNNCVDQASFSSSVR